MAGDILLVDDDITNIHILRTILMRDGHKVRPVMSGKQCLTVAKQHPPDLILLDVLMPHINGFETCRRLKQDPDLADIPVMFITALDTAEEKVKGFQVGAVDFISKPFHHDEVRVRVRSHVRLRQQHLELERKRAEEQRMYTALAELKDEFIAALSHDLRNPVNNINLYAQLLHERIACPDKRSLQYIERIQAQTDRLKDLVSTVLDIAKVQAGVTPEMAPVDCEAIIRRAVDNQAGAAAQRGVRVETQFVGPVATIQAEAMQLQRVIDNLIDNAIKYTDTGGCVSIEVEVAEDVVIRIRDTGVGIPAEDVPHIFDKFYRAATSEGREGTGLGLSLVKSVVEQHGGTIEVASTEGEGTCFTLRFARVVAQMVNYA